MEKGKAKQKLLYTIGETAEVLSCSEKTVSRLIHNGALPTIRLGTRIRIPCVGIQEWLDKNTRYNSMCVGSAVQGASTCHISASKSEVKASSGGHRSPMQTASELESLLEQRKKGKL